MKKLLLTGVSSLMLFAAAHAQTPPCTADSDACDEYISNVSLGVINNSSDCEFYMDYGISTDVTEGPTYTISIEIGYAYEDDEVAAWVDWNNDGDFDDADELISYTLINMSTTNPVMSNFTVPTGTAAGPKTLRVRMWYTGGDPIEPCGLSDWGEVEDYRVNVLVPTAAPVTDFSASGTLVPQNATVTLTDLSTNIPNSWAWTITPATGWSYTGGTNASSENPQVIFTTLGLYSVELTSGNVFGSDTETKTDYIEVVAALPTPCAATSLDCDEYFTNVTLESINNTTGCNNYSSYGMVADLTAGDSYTLSVNMNQYYDDDEIAAWIDWNNDGDFDDAGEQIAYELVVDGDTPLPYTQGFTVPSATAAGLKNMRVRISYEPTDGAITPCGDSEYGEVEDYYVNILPAPFPPVADFSASATTVAPSTTVTFTDLSTNVPTSWAWTVTPATGWSFAGGTDATSQNPQITFTTEGLYTVELTATNAFGSDTETKTDYIEVVTPTLAPVADFSASATSVAPATTVTFTDLSTNLPTSWSWTITPATGWSFAGGTNATSQNPQITFNTDGLYTIELTASNLAGSDTETKTDYIEVVTPVTAPVADFSASATSVAPATTVTFTDLSTNTPTSWNWVITPATGWSFSGGTDATSQNPQITFNTDGLYTVELTASNGGGSDTETKTDYIEVVTPVTAPVANFSASPTTVELGSIAAFTDLSTNTPTSWNWVITPATGWSFSGGTSASSQNPVVNFNVQGFYTIELTATNAGGSDTETKTDYIEVSDVTGFADGELSTINIYPNPTNGQLTIDLSTLGGITELVEITDLTGRVVYSTTKVNGKLIVDLTDETTGIYFVKVTTTTGNTITKKVVRL